MPSDNSNNTLINQARCRHASRLPEYRSPFGSRPTDSYSDIFIDVDSGAKDVVFCYTYGLYSFSYHEEPMYRVASSNRYYINLMMPHETGILFYWFKYTVTDDKGNDCVLFYTAKADSSDGEGMICSNPPRVGADEDKFPYAFQITVYNKDFRTPDQMKGAMIYQIFPDRFSRDKDFTYDRLRQTSPKPERIYHEDWLEDVDIYGKPETGYLACDFYGGSLRGIAEKLEYIKSLGVDIIYLNPIFEARSSHRYDTADYMTVDPVLGGTQAFMELVTKAEQTGIKLILDGVFSHTGADSLYFNKFDRFEENGAYGAYRDGKESRYRSWYNLYRDKDGKICYDSWWGFPDLPNVNENDLSYRNFIFGKDGVVDTWISRGASGIRLDVSDELPDSFIRQMRATIKDKTGGQGMLVGEVWEDASNKCSYGSYRDFLLGNTHDSVMGYTFRAVILDFMCGYIDAAVANSRLEGFRERYPAESYYCIMNLVSSHDVPRIMTMLSKPEDTSDREVQRDFAVDPSDYDRCEALSRMCFGFQIAYVGASCIYYGDEVLMQGYKDPFNRRTYPWNHLSERQRQNLAFVRRIARLRIDNSCLRTGFYKTLYAEGNLFAFERSLKDGCDYFGKPGKGASHIVYIMNRSDKPAYVSVTEDFNGTSVELLDRKTARPPLTNRLIFGGIENGILNIGLGSYSLGFVIY
ncbi:MAG: glycoside hydrolase family 13 protein [Saccharofermentans sp.]|nr:glycoside hydrolase family 13 protein [Mageeibacillus sp.]MCI1263914.1 glycoside hydrolase family 13 protein [Saccharofermentans sp.]MCI1275754.1 glycoside hydrolase family 13 protein [Saccharofermentans sp.]MCI2043736.1 glycoside hydrolase family 13 protein [Mageeibacillus sp.]